LIASLGLRVLADDHHYFPPYDAVPVARRATLQRHPEVRIALDSLGGRITVDEMRRLNYRVDGEKSSAEETAREFLRAVPQSAEAPRRGDDPR
jgi:osmoprotectant transport system substrate-binding protein